MNEWREIFIKTSSILIMRLTTQFTCKPSSLLFDGKTLEKKHFSHRKLFECEKTKSCSLMKAKQDKKYVATKAFHFPRLLFAFIAAVLCLRELKTISRQWKQRQMKLHQLYSNLLCRWFMVCRYKCLTQIVHWKPLLIMQFQLSFDLNHHCDGCNEWHDFNWVVCGAQLKTYLNWFIANKIP